MAVQGTDRGGRVDAARPAALRGRPPDAPGPAVAVALPQIRRAGAIRLVVLLGGLAAFAPLSNGVGIVAGSQLSGLLVRSRGPRPLLLAGLFGLCAGATGLLAAVASGAGLAVFLPTLFAAVASVGVVIPNSTALALTNHPRVAGSASALLGVVQFGIGAAVAPLVGIAGRHTATPMAVVIAALALGALAAVATLARGPSPEGPVELGPAGIGLQP